jgi:hypothetical protein
MLTETGEASPDSIATRLDRQRLIERSLGIAGVVLCLGILLQGLVDRIWALHTVVFNSDEAIDGLQALDITHGHFSALFWGAHYGGTQPYVDAVLFELLPRNSYTLRASTIAISLVGTYFIWKIARRVLEDRVTALAVTAISSAVPVATIFQLVYAYGFRIVTYSCLFLMIYLAIVIGDGAERWWAFVALGLVGGLGWWSNPEILYGAVPVLVLVAPVLWRRRASWAWLAPSAQISGGFLLGSLPWWWASIQTHFTTLQFQGGSSSLGARLSVYLRWVLPTQLGLRQYGSGAALFFSGHRLAFYALYGLCALVLTASAIAAMAVGGARRAIGAATAASPVIYVLSPATLYWQDGRFAIYFAPLFVMTVAIGLERLSKGLGVRRRRLAACFEREAVVVALVVVLLWSSWQLSTWGAVSSIWHWSDQADASAQATATALERAGVTTGWADYWTAYLLDFESGGRLELSATPGNVPRDQALEQVVFKSPRAIWLVSGPSNRAGTAPAASASAPGSLTFQQLTERFTSLGVSWTVRSVGGLWVVMPSRVVSPVQIGV